jgi:hypothetical protein
VTVIFVRFETNTHFLDSFYERTHNKFQENPTSKNRADKCRWTDIWDMTGVVGAFRAYANAPKNQTSVRVQETILVLRYKQVLHSCVYLTEQSVVLWELGRWPG